MKTNGEETKNAPAQAPTKTDTIGGMIERLKPALEKALPKHVTPDRLARVALTAVRNNPRLAESEPMTLLGSIMQAAQLGLEPNTPLGQCYIIPYKNGKTGRYEAQFQIGYQGAIDLANRAGVVVGAWNVDAADTFEYSTGLGKTPKHIPADKPSGTVVKYWAQYLLPDGRTGASVWSREQVEAHAKKYSKSYSRSDSAWQTAFDAMARKTVILDVLKYAPKSIELATALAADDHVVSFNEMNAELDLAMTPDVEYEVEE